MRVNNGIKFTLMIVVLVLIGTLPVMLRNGGYFLMESDYFNQQIPFIYETKRMLSSGIPFWSWNHYFGDNFIGAYSFYTLTSPFVWIDCLFPYRYLIWGIELTLLLKFICCGWASYAYLRRMEFSEQLSMLGALMYTFSSYVITNLFYYHFMEPLICFPLLLLAIESFLAGDRHGRSALIGASFLVAFINFYFSIGSFIAAAIYALCRVLGGQFEHRASTIAKGIGYICIGIGLASFILLPTFCYLNGGPRETFPQLGFKEFLYQLGNRAIYLFMPKLEEGPNPYFHVVSNWSGPAVALPVVGCFFALVYMAKHRDWLSLLLLVSLVFYLTPLNGAFTLFTSQTYVRWGYALCIFLILPTLRVIDSGEYGTKDLRRYLLLAFGIIIMVYAANSVWFFKRQLSIREFLYEVDWPLNLYIILLFLISLGFLYWYVKTRRQRVLMLGMTVCICLQFCGSTASREFATCKTNAWFADIDSVHKVTFINTEHPEGHRPFTYRTDFIAGKAWNLPLLTDRPAVCSWSSCINKAVMPLILSADTTKQTVRMQFSPVANRTSFDALMSVRQIMSYYKDPLIKVYKPAPVSGKRLLRHGANTDIYNFDYYIPMGFTYDSYMPDDEIQRLDTIKDAGIDIPLQLLANLWISADDTLIAAKYLPKGSMTTALSLDSLCKERRRETCDRFEGDIHGFSAHINLGEPNLVFFSVPADPGFSATVDGEPTKILKANLGLSAIAVPKGSHAIRFEYFPEGLRLGGVLSLGFLCVSLLVFIREKRTPKRAD